MAEMIPVDASLPPCPVDDNTLVALSSLDSDSFAFVETRHPNKLLEGLNSLRLCNIFCDVSLCCGRQEFPCHRNVLASFSPYFEAMFTTEWTESHQNKVVINGVEPQMIDMLVCYAYTSKVVITTENVQALLAASNLLNVTAVKEACCRYMERHMDEKNCVGIHHFAEAHSCKRLEKRSMDYILENFSVVYHQEDFLSLRVDKLTEILASDDINVPNEEMVFEAAMLWVEKCPKSRQSFEKVLEQIRLPLISRSFLHDVIEALDVVKESQGCQRLISEAKNQDLLPYSHRAQPRWSTVCEGIVTFWKSRDFWKSTDWSDVTNFFDPQTDQWRTLGCLPFALHRYGLVVSGSDLYVTGGQFMSEARSGMNRAMWRYDRSRDLWLELAPMNAARCDLGLVMLDGYVYAVGGWVDDMPADSVERYDPITDTWQLMESVRMPTYMYTCADRDPEFNFPVVALDGLIYVIGGEVGVYTYSPHTSVWTEVTWSKIRRSECAAITFKGKIFVIGGRDPHNRGGRVTGKVECYNPEADQWTICASLNEQRLEPGVAVVDGNMYVLGGYSTGSETRFHHTIERYCDERDTWEIVGEIPSDQAFGFGFKCVSFRLKTDAPTVNTSATAHTVPINWWGR